MSAPAPEPGRARTTIEDVFAVVRDYVADNLQGDQALALSLELKSGRPFGLPVPAAGPGACALSEDGRTLLWFGVRHPLSTGQAGHEGPVALLLRAYQDGTRDVASDALLAAAESAGGRVRDVFRGSTLWEEGLVGQVARGSWRLLKPDEVE